MLRMRIWLRGSQNVIVVVAGKDSREKWLCISYAPLSCIGNASGVPCRIAQITHNARRRLLALRAATIISTKGASNAKTRSHLQCS
jgi:hypothetical protein